MLIKKPIVNKPLQKAVESVIKCLGYKEWLLRIICEEARCSPVCQLGLPGLAVDGEDVDSHPRSPDGVDQRSVGNGVGRVIGAHAKRLEITGYILGMRFLLQSRGGYFRGKLAAKP